LRTSSHLVKTLDQMISTARTIGKGDAGHITVGFYTSLSAGNLRASLVEYAARFPKVDIRTHEGACACLFAGVDSGRIDIAITTGEPIARDGNVMTLWSERIMVDLDRFVVGDGAKFQLRHFSLHRVRARDRG
jgi:DNA-binding transcriptional LysR family regulator